MTPMPRLKELLTIVVPSKNEEGYIGNLLQSLSEQWYIEGVQIYVADAQSTDRTREIVNSYKDRLNVTVIEGGTVQVGRNAGATLSTTPYILFMDSDVLLFNEDTLVRALECVVKNRLDLLTLNIRNYSKDPRASIWYGAFNIFNNMYKHVEAFAVGAFFLTKTSTFREYEGFPTYVDNAEDYILSRQYNKSKFDILKGYYYGQDNRRFKKMGYLGMAIFMIKNFIYRNNVKYFANLSERVGYWK